MNLDLDTSLQHKIWEQICSERIACFICILFKMKFLI